MVRKANTAMDAGMWRPDKDTAEILETLRLFDEIFAVLDEDDGPKMKQVCDWARAEGRDQDISEECRKVGQSSQLSDANVETKVAEMEAARRGRNFEASDALRSELAAAGVVIENTKDGVRWRRK
jgi:cysteinyl-tRNA synthetase